ncbi:hypothetical protein [Sphingomonas pseudosanguinis]|uniref:Uncharacterized protein n=1 Tax=Sphingomonas pseudosanguinis TaxID=413712 RepID=A0A7W6AEA9_9SPHN|nr:hypothetical protein [Sphingomonas pseudosanguinis]MBB3880358.1 hypothetical protein [Sphingomonas pseudosanguinis]MBN3536391.1 hypothetical protein [Sphingomonas pseudosanguinis]
MAMHSFSEEKAQAVLDTFKAHHEMLTARAKSMNGVDLAASGELTVRAECISVAVENGQICLQLPLGFGSICLPIPTPFPDGTAAQACLDICTPYWVPTGVKITISIAGHVVLTKVVGKC